MVLLSSWDWEVKSRKCWKCFDNKSLTIYLDKSRWRGGGGIWQVMSGGWQQTSLGEPHIAFLQRRPFHPFPISSDLVILYIVFNLDVKGVYSERAVSKNDKKLFHQLLVASIGNLSRLTKKTTFIWWKKSWDVRANTPKSIFLPKRSE